MNEAKIQERTIPSEESFFDASSGFAETPNTEISVEKLQDFVLYGNNGFNAESVPEATLRQALSGLDDAGLLKGAPKIARTRYLIRAQEVRKEKEHAEEAATAIIGLANLLKAAKIPTGEWTVNARCLDADPEAFFLHKGSGDPREAREICKTCKVQQQCGEFAVKNGEIQGIWGGIPQKELRKIKKARKAKVKASA